MDAETIAARKAAIRADYSARYSVEHAEGWDAVIAEMPALQFPRGWKVKIIPPFAGAMVRFIAKKGDASVSVYADFYERLGCWPEPHWEIYPGPSGENERYSIATETDAMLAAISKSLRKMQRAARGSKPVRVETGTGSIEDESRAEGLAQTTPES